MKRVLIACECSGVVREAFRRRGFDAWSCDYDDTEIPGQHIKGNALRAFDQHWDLIVAHPPCTDLAVSGAKHFKYKQADGRQQKAIVFFMQMIYAPAAHVAVENPICIMSSCYRKPDQIVQPWWFGHGETKATCWWLKNLPLLKPTNIVDGREQRVWKMAPGKNRARDRSRTLEGVADAMAEQWGDYILNFDSQPKTNCLLCNARTPQTRP